MSWQCRVFEPRPRGGLPNTHPVGARGQDVPGLLPGRQSLSPDLEGRKGASGPPPSAPAMGPRRRSRKAEVPRRRTASPAAGPPRRAPSLGNRPRLLALEPASLQPGCEVGTAGSTFPFHRPENRARVRGWGRNLPTSGWRSPAARQSPAAGRTCTGRPRVPGPARDWGKRAGGERMAQAVWLLILILVTARIY